MSDKFDFEAYRRRLNRIGQWVYLAPVTGLILSDAVNNEIRIRRVTFVSRQKLPYVRQRFGIPERISELKHDKYRAQFFESAETFAIVRHSDRPEEAKEYCRSLVKHELSILSASQLGFVVRWGNACPTIQRGYHSGRVTELLLNENDDRKIMSGSHSGKLGDLHLDGQWKRWQEQGFFSELVDVLNNHVVDEGWRDDLERAAVLIGQSQSTTNLSQAFLWNIIALETLLAKRESNYKELLLKRTEAFLGWVHYWDQENYGERIRDIYRKRSNFVHSGDDKEISVKDLLFSDDLLFNLLMNLMQHIDRFSSKDDIIEFTEKVRAEHTLGIEWGVRPRTLRHVGRTYSERDYKEI